MQVPPEIPTGTGLESTATQDEANLGDHVANPSAPEPPSDSGVTVQCDAEGEQEHVPQSNISATDLHVRVEQACASHLYAGEDFLGVPLAYVLRQDDMASDENTADTGRNLEFGMLPNGPTLQSLHMVMPLSQNRLSIGPC